MCEWEPNYGSTAPIYTVTYSVQGLYVQNYSQNTERDNNDEA